MNIVNVEGLTKYYDNFILDNISFALEEGTITGFIGRNGAGKTTTMKAMLGIIPYDKGEISFFGKERKENELLIKRDIGYVSGGFHFYSNHSLKKITGVTKSFYSNWDDKRYKELIKKFNLDEKKTPAQLSEGMKVKYSIALALSHHGKLLILDEPTSGLDPLSREEILDILLKLQEEGVTILFSTHITSDLEACADNIIYIKNGKIEMNTTRKELLETYCYVEILDNMEHTYNKHKIIGGKKNKNGFCGLIKAKDQEEFTGALKPVSIDKIMIHLEEGTQYESITK